MIWNKRWMFFFGVCDGMKGLTDVYRSIVDNGDIRIIYLQITGWQQSRRPLA